MATNNIVVEGARIGFTNFSGKEGQFNPPGRRNFCWFIDDAELSRKLIDDGWNVKQLKPRNPDDDPQPYLQVAVEFKNFPPKIVIVTSRGKTKIDEGEVAMLDWAEIKNVDLIIRPYNWDVNGKTGTKAYLKSMYVTIEEDEFESKYYDVPDSAANAVVDEDIPF